MRKLSSSLIKTLLFDCNLDFQYSICQFHVLNDSNTLLRFNIFVIREMSYVRMCAWLLHCWPSRPLRDHTHAWDINGTVPLRSNANRKHPPPGVRNELGYITRTDWISQEMRWTRQHRLVWSEWVGVSRWMNGEACQWQGQIQSVLTWLKLLTWNALEANVDTLTSSSRALVCDVA